MIVWNFPQRQLENNLQLKKISSAYKINGISSLTAILILSITMQLVKYFQLELKYFNHVLTWLSANIQRWPTWFAEGYVI